MSSVKSKLAQALIALRGERSAYAVSKAMGIQRAALHNYEQGRKVPEDKNLELLSNFYQVDFFDLKALIFEDEYPEGSRDKEILTLWVGGKKSRLLGSQSQDIRPSG